MAFGNFISKIISGAVAVNVKPRKPFEAEALLHWKTLLCTFFVMTFLVLVASFFVHADISRGDFSAVTKVSPPESSQVTVERLEKLASYFETKSVTFEQMRRSRVFVVDPSI